MSTIIFDDYRNVTPKYSDLQFDLALCDIPYGIDVANMAYLKEVKHTVKQKNGARLNANAKKIPYTAKSWDKEVPPQAYFDELRRISKHQIIFGVEYVNWTGLGNGRIKWNKGVAEGSSFKKYEMAYCSMIETEIELPLLWSGMFQAKSLSEPMVQQANKKLNEKRIHPCHKPIMLYDKIFQDYGFKGMKVIDTHGGSMSIVVSAIKNGIDITCIEVEKEYYDKGKKKILNFINQGNLFTTPDVKFIQ